MVFIEDRDGIYDAPLNKVWELVKLHTTERSLIHPSAKNVTTNLLSENTFIHSWEEEFNGQIIQLKVKGTVFYPLGIAFEMIDGFLVGSNYFIYYQSVEENKTRVIVTGEFKSDFSASTVDDEKKLSSFILSKFEKAFEEDQIYLKTL